jgi:hypothetical protein
MRLSIELASSAGVAWAQRQVSEHHYLHNPVDSRCSVLGYLVMLDGYRVGCLLFGRPEATRCYSGGLTYGSQVDVRSSRAYFDRWEIINLARVWLSPRVQLGGSDYIPCAASQVIGAALKRVVVDYLHAYPPVYPEEPWQLQMCLSYCDTRQLGHHGTIYRAAGFWRARVNRAGIETWVRPLRPLRRDERDQILRRSGQSFRSCVYRSQRLVTPDQARMF